MLKTKLIAVRSLVFLSAFAVTLITGAKRASCEKLTHNGREKRDLVFLDASTLVYVEQVGPRQLAIMKLDLESGASERLHPDMRNNEFEPCFSPNGKHYAFLQNIGNLNLRLVIRDRESKAEADFRQGGFSGMRSPCFTADSQRVLYAYPEDGRQHIWSCDLKCENRVKLIDSSGSNNWPRVTPDGKSIVFGSTRDGNFELYRSSIDGTDVRRLTDNPRQDIRPAISAEGSHIAFTSNRDGNYEIYVMELASRSLKRMTSNPERDDFAAWHPNGRLAWVAEESGRFDIHVVSVGE